MLKKERFDSLKIQPSDLRPLKKITREQRSREIFDLILDSIYIGVVVTDPDGYIMYLNKPYGEFLGIDPEEQIGKHVTDVIENSRMHIVAKTGRPEINHIGKLKGHKMVVHRIPIKKDGKVVAVYGQVLFKDIKDLRNLANKLSFLESKVNLYEEELFALRSMKYTFDNILGVSTSIKSLKKDALKAAKIESPILITGESGVGKDLFAQAIHNASIRKLGPFIRIDCAAIPKDLLESELFGYEKGAFTGARPNGKPGKFEMANRGTVFLDEIGDLPIEMQPKLLRVIERKEFEHVGGTSLIKTEFRLIAASNQDLKGMVSKGLFRKDLFYRVNVIPLHIPPLRERKDDIIHLTHHFLRQFARDSSLPAIKVDPRAEEALRNYDWPGNVRELYNVLVRTLSFLESKTIYLCNLPFYLSTQERATGSARSSLKHAHLTAEMEAIRRALVESEYNKARASKLLGIHRSVLYRKMKKYNLSLSA